MQHSPVILEDHDHNCPFFFGGGGGVFYDKSDLIILNGTKFRLDTDIIFPHNFLTDFRIYL